MVDSHTFFSMRHSVLTLPVLFFAELLKYFHGWEVEKNSQ